MDSVVKRNILFFQNSILPADGGVPRVSDIISKELTRRGYKCFFVYYNKDNERYSGQIKLKVNLKHPFNKTRDAILQFINQNDINAFVCQNAYDNLFIKIYKVIRSAYPSYSFLCFLHASPDYWQITYQSKSDFSQHKFLVNNIKKVLKKIIYPLYNPYVKTTAALYNICDKFVLLSDSFKKSFIELYAVRNADNKLVTIPNPLTFADYISVQELDQKEKIVLIISRLDEHQKKISVALRIWKKITQGTNSDWKLLIVGTGPDEDYYKQFVKDNKLNNVLFFGQKSNVIEYYKRSSIFLMTSIWEGLPMSLLEGQQNGVVPIVFDNFSAVYDVISDGDNGYIIHNNNIDQFAEKLSGLLSDKDLLYKMSVKAIERSKRYHVNNIVNEWEKLITL